MLIPIASHTHFTEKLHSSGGTQGCPWGTQQGPSLCAPESVSISAQAIATVSYGAATPLPPRPTHATRSRRLRTSRWCC